MHRASGRPHWLAQDRFWYGNDVLQATLGFIVIQLDAVGTPIRSKAFHAAYYW